MVLVSYELNYSSSWGMEENPSKTRSLIKKHNSGKKGPSSFIMTWVKMEVE